DDLGSTPSLRHPQGGENPGQTQWQPDAVAAQPPRQSGDLPHPDQWPHQPPRGHHPIAAPHPAGPQPVGPDPRLIQPLWSAYPATTQPAYHPGAAAYAPAGQQPGYDAPRPPMVPQPQMMPAYPPYSHPQPPQAWPTPHQPYPMAQPDPVWPYMQPAQVNANPQVEQIRRKMDRLKSRISGYGSARNAG
ncbi:MAG: hypothetical protein VR78_16040, partial [Hoeflea sp. BRH_c9]